MYIQIGRSQLEMVINIQQTASEMRPNHLKRKKARTVRRTNSDEEGLPWNENGAGRDWAGVRVKDKR
jgi:hypothetical protein